MNSSNLTKLRECSILSSSYDNSCNCIPLYNCCNSKSYGGAGATGDTGPTGPAGANGVSGGLTLFLDTAGGTAPQTGTLLQIPVTTTQTNIAYKSTSAGQLNVLMGTFITPVGSLQSTFIVGGEWDLNMYAKVSPSGGTESFYWKLYSVDVNNLDPIPIAPTGTPTNTIINTTFIDQYTNSIYVPQTSLSSLSRRLRIEIYGNFPSNNKTLTFYFRDNTVSHVHTTLLTNTQPTNTVIYPTTTPYSVTTGANNEQITIISDVAPGSLNVTTTTGGFIDTNNSTTYAQITLPSRYNMVSIIYNTSLNKWLVGYRSTGVTLP